jgi:hypothetical protein
MVMGSLKMIGAFLFAGAFPALADDAGRAAAKGYAHLGAKSATAKAAPARPQDSMPGPGRMQVEEPAAARDTNAQTSKAWQKSHAKGLTDAQKAAFRERKEKMEGMVSLIKAKRKALQDAKPEERAALARELHSLILEKDPDPSAVASATAARVEDNKTNVSATEPEPDKSPEKVKTSESQTQRREEIRARQMERLKRLKAKEDGD